jgi:hypothetical protein
MNDSSFVADLQGGAANAKTRTSMRHVMIARMILPPFAERSGYYQGPLNTVNSRNGSEEQSIP